MGVVSAWARHASPLRIFCLSAAIWLLGSHSVSFAQNEAVPPAKDTIFARKIFMGTVDMNMDEVETMLAPGGKLDVTDAREHLNTISVLLMAFPQLLIST
jgi:hypothetical protein